MAKKNKIKGYSKLRKGELIDLIYSSTNKSVKNKPVNYRLERKKITDELRKKGYRSGFCGPIAISLLTGKSISEILDDLEHRKKLKGCGGVSIRETLTIIEEMGFKVKELSEEFDQVVYQNYVEDPNAYQLKAVIRDTGFFKKKKNYLITSRSKTSSHLILVIDQQIADNLDDAEKWSGYYLDRVYEVSS